MAKYGYLEGKAATLAVLRADQLMSRCSISGDTPAIKRIRVGGKQELFWSGSVDETHEQIMTCTVSVEFLEAAIAVEVVFRGCAVGSYNMFWRPHVVRSYYLGDLVSELFQ